MEVEELASTSPSAKSEECSESSDTICRAYLDGKCRNGKACVQKHTSYVTDIVCYFFLEGNCNKGSFCRFLHTPTPEKLPECRVYLQKGECSKLGCRFKHADREVKECIYYNSGFCTKGLQCKYKHIRKELCQNYNFLGFCSAGSKCKDVHLNDLDESLLEDMYYQTDFDPEVVYSRCYELCFRCMKFGHLPYKCSDPVTERSSSSRKVVRCYRCSEFDHKANECPEGYKRRCL